MTTEMVTLAPEDLMKPHSYYDKKHLAEIVQSMESNGWQGRPLLAVEVMENCQAITGTHRLYAACEVLEEVPVYLISEEDWREAGFEAEDILHMDTEVERAEFFERLGNAEASSLYEQEGE